MSTNDLLATVQSLIDDALRAHLDDLRTTTDEPDEKTGAQDALLGGWVMVTDWIDPEDGEHWYFRLSSPMMPTHSRMGLLQLGLQMEDE